jgi:NAD(P) transhydrogenase subunit alpha
MSRACVVRSRFMLGKTDMIVLNRLPSGWGRHTPWLVAGLLAITLVPHTRLLAAPQQTVGNSETTESTSNESSASSVADATPATADKAESNELATEPSEVVEDENLPASTSSPRSLIPVSKASLLVGSLTVFMLAVFVGFEVITKVPPTLHTPLMSGSNAISGITIVGAMITAGHAAGGFGSLLGFLAVVLAMVNVVGGFLVTRRMLMMFKKK